MKIVSVVGARPQFIKAAVVSRQLRACAGWNELVIHTGQHYDDNMSDIFFREMGIVPADYHLGVGSGGHGEQTAKMLCGIEQILSDVKPDWLIVYGDTNSTLAGALAASKLHIPVAHVEAGLRSFNRRMPEEINRILTDHASDLLLAPTNTAVTNLRDEGIALHKICHVGDVMYDAVLLFRELAARESKILAHLRLAKKQYMLATIHRAENTDDPLRLRAIFKGLIRVARDIPVIVPLHPRTKLKLQVHNLWDTVASSLTLIDPVGYFDMITLQSNASLLATDSGGMQKEAFFCCTPCVTLRDETEWVELVELGWNRLVSPTEHSDIGTALLDALAQPTPPYPETNPYGSGDSSAQVAIAIAKASTFSRAA